MNNFIQFIPTLLFIIAIANMLCVCICEARIGSSKKTKDEEKIAFYTLRMYRCDFSCQWSMALAGVVLFFQEDDPWYLLMTAFMGTLAISTYIKLKKFLHSENGIKNKE